MVVADSTAMNALFAVVFVVLPAAELHVQCPAGTGAVIRGDTVVCEPLPAAQPQKRIIVTPPPAPVTTVDHMELSGLQGVPELCGLGSLVDEQVELTAESVHIAVAECAAEIGARPLLKPTRWLVFRFVPLDEKAHQVLSPPEPWAEAMNQCLLQKPARLPKVVRGRGFTAWYLMAANANAIPSSPACVERR